MTVRVRIIEQRHEDGPGYLGRNVEHDESSRAYRVTAVPVRPVLWHRRVPVFDQGNLGCCTGAALAGALSTHPFRHRFHEHTAIRLYEAATHLDDVPGAYPPDDTGSSGLAVCKAAAGYRMIREYRHAFGLDDALAALAQGPVITGISWRTGCDTPDSSGLVRWTGDVRGGHEFCVVGVDPDARTVRCVNSWGTGWGDRGFFTLTWDDWAAALADDGDVTAPVA